VRFAVRRTAFSAASGNSTGTKYSSGIKIILARLVNHAEMMVLGGGRGGDDLIQLSQFQRSGIVLVLHADDESWLWLTRSHSSGCRMSVSLAEYGCDHARAAAAVQHGNYDERFFVRSVESHSLVLIETATAVR